jgi:hypothetical protein
VVLDSLVKAFPEVCFGFVGKETKMIHENEYVLHRQEFSFDEIFNAATVFVCKLGYCTVGRCIEGRKKLLFPTRIGFREDNLLKDVCKYIPAIEISKNAWENGNCVPELKQLLATDFPSRRLESDGAVRCAKKILAHFEGWFDTRLNSSASSVFLETREDGDLTVH